MSNAIFPALPGLKLDASMAPRFNTGLQESVSGREARAALMAYPKWSIGLSVEFLRAGNAGVELQTLEGCFLQMRGRWDSFLLAVPNHDTVAAQAFGTGDGANKIFQLVRTLGAGGFGFTEPVQNPNTVTNVSANGVTVSGGYSIGSTGLLTFVTAPAAGVALTWSGTYYHRVRWDYDQAEFARFLTDLYELKSVKLVGAPGNRV